jgi:hypothetical protein
MIKVEMPEGISTLMIRNRPILLDHDLELKLELVPVRKGYG